MMNLIPALAWGVPFIGLGRLVRQKPALGDFTPVSGVPLTVIVPARNEAVNIENVAASILASTYHPLQLILVDDRSSDNTAARMATVAQGDSRVVVISGAELPAEWFGKPWACAQGAAAATGQILLFTDADTWHDPALLGHAVAALEATGADLLTLGSHQLCVTFWERLVMPQIMGMLGIRFAPQVVNRATRPDQVVANGQFIMMPRAAYDELGGHATVRDKVVEDLALAQLTIRSGKRLRMLYSGKLLTTRMYRSLGELVEGWSKNIYIGAREASPDLAAFRALAPIGPLLVQLFWLLPWLALVAGFAVPAALSAIALSICFWMLISRGMEIPLRYGVLYPVGAAMTGVIVARSIWRGAGRIEWRGRTYGSPQP